LVTATTTLEDRDSDIEGVTSPKIGDTDGELSSPSSVARMGASLTTKKVSRSDRRKEDKSTVDSSDGADVEAQFQVQLEDTLKSEKTRPSSIKLQSIVVLGTRPIERRRRTVSLQEASLHHQRRPRP
jgi:hypothetical protein